MLERKSDCFGRHQDVRSTDRNHKNAATAL